MSLFRRGEIGAAGRRPARLDYRVFVATLQAFQLSTATARAGSRFGEGRPEPPPASGEPLADILLGSQRWQDAVLAQGGSFNPGIARGGEQR